MSEAAKEVTMRDAGFADPVLVVLERQDARWANLFFHCLVAADKRNEKTFSKDMMARIADALYRAIAQDSLCGQQ